MILKVADLDKAIEVLQKGGIRLVCQHELNEIFGN